MYFTSFKFPPKVNCLSIKKINICFRLWGYYMWGGKPIFYNTLCPGLVGRKKSQTAGALEKQLALKSWIIPRLEKARNAQITSSEHTRHLDWTTPVTHRLMPHHLMPHNHNGVFREPISEWWGILSEVQISNASDMRSLRILGLYFQIILGPGRRHHT